MYGTQTLDDAKIADIQFENDVKMYGTQTSDVGRSGLSGLRMM